MSYKSFKLTVKDGDTKLAFNEKRASYEYENTDYITSPGTLGEALQEFLEWVNDDRLAGKVTLSVSPKAKAKSKKSSK